MPNEKLASNIMPKTYEIKACKPQIQYVSNSFKNYDVIILAGNRIGYIPVYSNYLQSTLNIFKHNNKHVIIMEDVPIYPETDIIKRSAILPQSIRNILRHRYGLQIPIESPQQVEDISKKYSNVYFFNVKKEIISKIASYPFYNNEYLYVSKGHISSFGSLLFAKTYLFQPIVNQDLKLTLSAWGVIK